VSDIRAGECRELQDIINRDQQQTRVVDLASQIAAFRVSLGECGISPQTLDSMTETFAEHLMNEAFSGNGPTLAIYPGPDGIGDIGGIGIDHD